VTARDEGAVKTSLAELASQLYEAAGEPDSEDFELPEAPRPPAPPQRIGFYGLGDIGARVAQRLLSCRASLTVYNRTAVKSSALADLGAAVANSESHLVGSSDVIITCLHGPEADRDVYLREDGLLAHGVAGKVFVNTSTIGPGLAEELGRAAEARGARYLDAPLLGFGRYAALAGSLIVPVGAAAADLDAVRGVLGLFATTVEHVGAVGAGQVVKLAFNAQFAVASVAVAESVRFAIRGGANPAALERILLESGGASTPIKSYTHRMVEGLHQRRGTYRTLAKDLDVANAFAAELGEHTPVGLAAAAVFHAGLEAGLGALDVAALVHVRDIR
jgi:3-hydroxyisobutyrate dehydrogenase